MRKERLLSAIEEGKRYRHLSPDQKLSIADKLLEDVMRLKRDVKFVR